MRKRILTGVLIVLFAWVWVGWAGPTADVFVKAGVATSPRAYFSPRGGCEVRVYLDESQKAGKHSKVRELLAGGAEVRFEDGPGLMHNKFCVIDGQVLITGSYNWTGAAEEKNDENVLVIFSGEAVKMFEEQFERMWKENH